jgi:hypothetical protein
MLIITTVVGTSAQERVWHCMVKNDREAQREARFSAAQAQHIVEKQLQMGFLAPKFLLEKTGPMLLNLRGAGRNPKLVYRNCKFVGFQKWEFIAVDTVQRVLRQKQRKLKWRI